MCNDNSYIRNVLLKMAIRYTPNLTEARALAAETLDIALYDEALTSGSTERQLSAIMYEIAKVRFGELKAAQAAE